jgi:hypothetical protein
LRNYGMKASIGRRTLPITTSYLGCTTCIIIRKFLKSIKIYLHLNNFNVSQVDVLCMDDSLLDG